MGESLIVRKGGGGSSSSGNIFRTEIITINTNWVVPKSKNQSFTVRIFGGGGAGGNISTGGGGGGGGWMNSSILNLNAGDIISINLGKVGSGFVSGSWNSNGSTGGSSFFGSYLSANGGEGGISSNGGNGGSGSGAGNQWGNGGHGYQFGGNGGIVAFYDTNVGNNTGATGGGGYGGNGGSIGTGSKHGEFAAGGAGGYDETYGSPGNGGGRYLYYPVLYLIILKKVEIFSTFFLLYKHSNKVY